MSSFDCYRRLDVLTIAIVVAVVGCTNATEAPVPLPPADPGVALTISARGSTGSDPFPAIGWDLKNNRVIVGSRPSGSSQAIIFAIDLETRTQTSLETATGWFQMLQVAASTGGVFYMTADGQHSLIHLGSGPIASPKRSRFLVSADERWLVFYDNGWRVTDQSTGASRFLADSLAGWPFAIDAGGDQVFFVGGGSFGANSPLRVATVSTGAVRTITAPSGSIALDAAFVGGRLRLFIERLISAPGTRRLEYSEWEEGTGSERTIGAVAIDYRTWCAVYSWETGTAVVAVMGSWNFTTRSRFQFMAISGGSATPIGSADLWLATDCSLSPDGQWFMYGEGYDGKNVPGKLYLKHVP